MANRVRILVATLILMGAPGAFAAKSQRVIQGAQLQGAEPALVASMISTVRNVRDTHMTVRAGVRNWARGDEPNPHPLFTGRQAIISIDVTHAPVPFKEASILIGKRSQVRLPMTFG